ncbi:MAG: YciI family protein [Actinobacteria bacterium]|nr:YciI family protein [Actinomycetota bacterium]
MKYALLIYATPGAAENAQPRAGQGVFDNWLDYTIALRQSGALLGAEQLDRTDTATSVFLQDGERLLTDGPFMETKEHLGGFYLIDVPDLDTALDWAARMPVMRYGTVEVRPVKEGQKWQEGLR